MNYEYLSNKNGVYKYGRGDSLERISNPMGIRNIYFNIDTNQYKAEIEFSAFKETRTIQVDRAVYLQRNSLLTLQSVGLDVTHNNVAKLVDYFREEEDRKLTNVKNVHSTLGFGVYNKKRIYKLYEAIGIESIYDGVYDIKPKGSYDAYKKILKDEVWGNYALEFILAASMSAVLIGYLGESLDLESPIIHLVGNSSTGKSSAMKLAISAFSSPNAHGNSLFTSYNGTNNALVKKITGLTGVPYALDELSMSSTANFTTFIYTLANGSEKERLTKDSTLMAKNTFRTTIFSNGEKSLISNASKAAGVQVRVIEILNRVFTSSSGNAERIQETILKNNGFLGPEFARLVMNQGEQKLSRRYDSVRKILLDTINDTLSADKLTPRRCNKYAIILLSAELLQELLGLELQIYKIRDLLIQVERESLVARNFKESVLDFIKDFVAIHNTQFDSSINNYKGSLGKIIQKKDCIEVQMNKTSFQNMLKEGRYEDPDVVLKELKSSGYLNCEKDRFTRSRRNDLGFKEDVYVIVLKNEDITPTLKNPDIPDKFE